MENKGFIIVSKTNVENDDIIVVATGVNFFGKFNIRTMNYFSFIQKIHTRYCSDGLASMKQFVDWIIFCNKTNFITRYCRVK